MICALGVSIITNLAMWTFLSITMNKAENETGTLVYLATRLIMVLTFTSEFVVATWLKRYTTRRRRRTLSHNRGCGCGRFCCAMFPNTRVTLIISSIIIVHVFTYLTCLTALNAVNDKTVDVMRSLSNLSASLVVCPINAAELMGATWFIRHTT